MIWNIRQRTAVLPETRVHVDDTDASRCLSDGLIRHLKEQSKTVQPISIVCIGSDRSTGDALGPLVGTRLQQSLQHLNIKIRGSLEKPVHAANLSDTLTEMQHENESHLVIAIDACLGRNENVGTACVKSGPLKPGTGVNKTLPSVGDIHMIGVVNVGGFMEYFVLQNTRLSLVVRLAEVIADATTLALNRYFGVKEGRHVAVTLET